MKRIKILSDKCGVNKIFVGDKEFGTVEETIEEGFLIYTATFYYELDALKILPWKGDLYNFEEYINQKASEAFNILTDEYEGDEV